MPLRNSRNMYIEYLSSGNNANSFRNFPDMFSHCLPMRKQRFASSFQYDLTDQRKILAGFPQVVFANRAELACPEHVEGSRYERH